MSPETYRHTSGFLRDSFGIPKSWFRDALHVNGAEVIGTTIATVAVALRWNRAETGEFSRIAGSLGLSSIVSANPALAVVSVVVLARAYMKARGKGDYMDIVDGLAKGGIGTGMFLGASAVVGGPVWIGMLSGLCVAMVANKAMSNVSVADVRSFLERTVRSHLLSEA